jgi:hypothetical protein
MFEFDMVKLVILLLRGPFIKFDCSRYQCSSERFILAKDTECTILLHFGYKICSVKSLNIVWKKHEKMEISILHIKIFFGGGGGGGGVANPRPSTAFSLSRVGMYVYGVTTCYPSGHIWYKSDFPTLLLDEILKFAWFPHR